MAIYSGYGFGLYHACHAYGMWFGWGQVQIRRWAIDLCLFKKDIREYGLYGYNRHWFTIGR